MIFIAAGTMAGCSAQATRFGGGGIDDLFTASTPNQRQIIKQQQPYPGDTQVAAAPVERAQTTPVSRNALPPVSSQPLPPVNEPAPALAPVSSASSRSAEPAPALAPVAAANRLDQTVTGTVSRPPQPAMASLENDPEGWSRAGGTQITAKEGETVYNLSRRFGVPANVLMKVNGLSEQSGLQAGQKVIIPTYVYSSRAPVSAPDSNPNVADAKSSTGTRYDVPANKVPVPATAPNANVAVLPQAPKTEGGKPGVQGSSAPGTYKVQAGDTLTRIARNTGVSVAALKSANGLQDGVVRIGQTLQIPSGNAATVAAAGSDPVVTGATGPAQPAQQTQPAPQAEKVAAYTPPRKATKVIEQAEQENTAATPNSTGIDRMRWPVRGRIISAYGKGGGKSNDGIDIQVPEGTPVKAAENGVVIYAGDGLKEFGNTVLVRHENGLVTVYGHASELKVSRGEKVKRGQEIARSGMSGSTDSPKLHFEVRKNSSPVNPTTYLE
ncbi:peptidoglycan DD-metalloendopeptidase family protein [Pseudaminobacter sp. NGMCC 1.201702]|uniref:peptidoglycan DD-metalloendopeptidase family protein n=1 Tax=Pseudaminobacter sp. NGMCC 1.201702 TaxID=3391825 RepID=UPI0039EFEBCC